MPELPEVETTLRGISPHIVGQRIQTLHLRQTHLRWPIPLELPQLVRKRILQTIERRGKYLLFTLDNEVTLLWHLGMSGSLRIINNNEAPRKHDHVELVFNNECRLRFHDPRRFGALLYTKERPEDHTLLTHLGPEPLGDQFTPEYLYRRSRKRVQAIKTLIMDSRIVAGIGNIYANEALFSAGIHPLKAADKLSQPACARLVTEIQTVLTNAIKQGGTTLRDFVGGDGKPGYFTQQLNVYGRGALSCKSCSKPLTEKRIGQRSTVYCTRCQR